MQAAETETAGGGATGRQGAASASAPPGRRNAPGTGHDPQASRRATSRPLCVYFEHLVNPGLRLHPQTASGWTTNQPCVQMSF